MMKEISTVKRKANVGERILITNRYHTEGRYKDGDILVYSGEMVIFPKEYEVIIEEVDGMTKGIIEQMQSEINELKSRVGALEEAKRPKVFSYKPEVEVIGKLAVLSPQQIRDEIVAKAKADVASRYNPRGRIANKWGDYRDVEFIVNKEKRTVVVLLRGYISGRVYEKGIAKADPSDCFNTSLGKAISLRRALGLEVPAEYYSAPAPTEVRVGDGVWYSGRYPRLTVAEVTDLALEEVGLEFLTNKSSAEYKIIDDSRGE